MFGQFCRISKGEMTHEVNLRANKVLLNIHGMERHAGMTLARMPAQASEVRRHTWQEVKPGSKETACLGKRKCNLRRVVVEQLLQQMLATPCDQLSL